MAMLNFAALAPKTAAEKKEYSFDWSEELAKGADTIAGTSGDSNSTWASSGGGLVINTIDKPKTHDSRTTTVWVNAGSTPGDYTLTNTITTSSGRILVASATVKVVA